MIGYRVQKARLREDETSPWLEYEFRIGGTMTRTKDGYFWVEADGALTPVTFISTGDK